MSSDQSEHRLAFRCMACDIVVIVGQRGFRELPAPADAALDAQRWLEDFDARLSRFKPRSELSRMNADQREAVPVSPLLSAAVAAGLWAAEQTDGLVDPTLVDEIERAGYASSWSGMDAAPLADALAAAPARRPAQPDPEARWRRFRVDSDRGIVQRPPGFRFDTGGTGKGLAADALFDRLPGYERVAIDCAGDLRVGGPGAREDPFEVDVVHPLSGEVAHLLRIAGGGVATSGIGSRLWQTPDGGFGHHLLDPATGLPAWTGLISATALAPSTLQAETLSKAALLAGPEAARGKLAEYGGVVIRDDGDVELIGPVSRTRFRVRMPEIRPPD